MTMASKFKQLQIAKGMVVVLELFSAKADFDKIVLSAMEFL